MFTEDQKQRYVRLMEETCLTKREIARQLGMSYNTFLQYEARWGVRVVRRVLDPSAGAAATGTTPVGTQARVRRAA
jgi:hypothetical protein